MDIFSEVEVATKNSRWDIYMLQLMMQGSVHYGVICCSSVACNFLGKPSGRLREVSQFHMENRPNVTYNCCFFTLDIYGLPSPQRPGLEGLEGEIFLFPTMYSKKK